MPAGPALTAAALPASATVHVFHPIDVIRPIHHGHHCPATANVPVLATVMHSPVHLPEAIAAVPATVPTLPRDRS